MQPPAHLYLFPEHIVWASAGFAGGTTQRPAPALLLGAWGALGLHQPGAEPLSARGFVLPPLFQRAVDAQGSGFISLNPDPASASGRQLMAWAAGQARSLDEGRVQPALEAARTLIEQSLPGAEAWARSEAILQALLPASELPPLDPRIVEVVGRLRAELPVRPDLSGLAAGVGLSAGRLSHLFRAQLGIPMRSYLLWLKMHRAAALFARDWTITAVAAEIGFADAAHLNRVFRRFFSVQPSWLADATQVRVYDGLGHSH